MVKVLVKFETAAARFGISNLALCSTLALTFDRPGHKMVAINQ